MVASGKAKYQRVVSSLRDGIVKGLYRPGHRFPTRPEMVEKFGVSIATLQRALDALSEDGFIRARTGAGTFVVDNPPHLCNYAVAAPKSGLWSCFYDSLREAIRSGDLGDVEFNEYITSRDVAFRQGVNNLCRDASSRRLAGIIVSGDPVGLQDTGIFDIPAIPCVATQYAFDVPCPRVYLNHESFLKRAVEFLFARGRRRIAHLFMDFEAHPVADFEEHVRRLNIEVRPYWIQSVAMHALFRSATNVIHLLSELEGDKKPDALIIHDDNLVEHTASGLLAAGIRVPEDLEIVTIFNYPTHTHCQLPMTRIGLDMRKLLQTCIEVLNKRRKGEPVPAGTTLDALFEDEIVK